MATEESDEPTIEGANERVKTVIPAEESPSARCSYCGHPFTTERLCTLHLSERHRQEWTEAEQERYESAYDTESDELFVLHVKVVGALVVTLFAFTYVYAFVWS